MKFNSEKWLISVITACSMMACSDGSITVDSPSEETVICGDGQIVDYETCDDGNTEDGDGCSSECETEYGWECQTPGDPCTQKSAKQDPVCGNGTLDDGETCDDGNTDNSDGCDSKCKPESGWTCEEPGEPCTQDDFNEPAESCGNSQIDDGETCDDGNTESGDGCSASCSTEAGWTCSTPGQPCTKNPVIDTPVCGNGSIESDESCDDGNNKSGDGCSSSCTIEDGWTCAAPGQPCTKPQVNHCGNGILDDGETCDDGNKTGGDGCSSVCSTEDGYICALPGIACEKINVFNKDSIKILAIGNSFSDDAMVNLYGVLKALGYKEVEVANLFIGACSLAKHANNLTASDTSYNFKTIGDSTGGIWDDKNNKNYNAIKAMKLRKWDFVSIQQNSPLSGVPSTYNKDLTNIIESVKKNAPTAKIIWHMTWAFQQGCVRNYFVYYGKSQAKMYDMIIHTTIDKIIPNKEFSFIIPTGTAIQNVRTSFIGDNITRDGFHLTHNNGRFLASLMWAKKITNKDISKIKYRPSGYEYTARQFKALVEAVDNAYYHPFVVTQSDDDLLGTHYNPNTELRDVVKAAGHNLDNYTELSFGVSPKAYYNSANVQDKLCKTTKLGDDCSSAILMSKETNATSSIFETLSATRIFTRYEIPEGSIIALKDGYQYRPEAWEELNKINDSSVRPALTTKKVTVTDAKWWGDFKYRAFDISKENRPALSDTELKNLNSAIAIFVPKKTPTAETVAKNAGYDMSKYKELPLDLTYHAYWNPATELDMSGAVADQKFPTKLFFSNSTASQLAATKIFRKKDIPNGSLIVVAKGYQYRPDAWESLEKPVSSRPAIVDAASKDSVIVVDDAWWGSFKYRAFNIAESGKPALDYPRQHALKDIFAVYVPL